MGKRIPIDADELKVQCAGHWPEILRALAPALSEAVDAYGRGEKARAQGVSCPVHGSPNGRRGDGFKLYKDADKTGGGLCNSCGFFPSGFKLLEWVNGWSFRETLEAVAEHVGYAPSTGQAHKPKRPAKPVIVKAEINEKDEQKKLYFLKKAWAERLTLDHPDAEPARRYFANRGIPLDAQPWELANVFFHSDLYFEKRKGKNITSPAVLELVYDTEGRPVTLHRLFITPDGRKAFGGQSKRAMPYSARRTMSGGYVPIAPIYNGVLGVAEGLETAMSVMQATGLPCWTTINAVNLERVNLPKEAQWVVVWADYDRESGRGQEAAFRLQRRLLEEGRQSVVLFPENLGNPKGTDWNDVLVTKGIEAIPDQDAVRREFRRLKKMTA